MPSVRAKKKQRASTEAVVAGGPSPFSIEPLVSIIVFVRNAETQIARCLDSILSQSYANIECVIQDGASTDGTLPIIRSYTDRRIKIVSEPDSGPSEAVWRGMQRCQGEIVGSCPADGELSPGAVAVAVAAFKKMPHVGAITGDISRIDESGAEVEILRGVPFSPLDYLMGGHCPHWSSSFFSGRALRSVGLLTDRWSEHAFDFELWSRLGLDFDIARVTEILSKSAANRNNGGGSWPAVRNQLASRSAVLRLLFAPNAMMGSIASKDYLMTMCQLSQHLNLFRNFVATRQFACATKMYELIQQSISMTDFVESRKGLEESAPRSVGVASDDPAIVGLRWTWPACPPPENGYGYLSAESGARDVVAIAGYYLAAYEFYQNRKTTVFGHAVAMAFQARGQMDQSIETWRGSQWGNSEGVHGLALQAMIKSYTVTASDLEAAHKDWAAKYALPAPDPSALAFPAYDGTRKINVGYCCSFWNTFTIRGQALPFIAERDRFKFSVTAYSPVPCPDKSITKHFDKFVEVGAMSHAQFAELVRADKIDILCEFTGFSPGHRFAAMGGRCAPVQVSYLNHTGTSGTPNVDYLVADEIAMPPDQDRHCTEEVYRLPGTFFCFNYDWDVFPEILPSPYLKRDYVTFGCFGSESKINDVLIRLWAELIKAVPNSRLFLRNFGLSSPINRNFMERRFVQWGIRPDQLRLEGGGTRDEIIASYNEHVDISLDTWPYCGGNTIAESIWTGVPVITLQGDKFNSSYGASLLAASGCEDLVAHSFDEYIAIAKNLAADKEKLIFYRKNIRTMMKTHGFGDPVHFARKIDRMFEQMMNIWAGIDAL